MVMFVMEYHICRGITVSYSPPLSLIRYDRRDRPPPRRGGYGGGGGGRDYYDGDRGYGGGPRGRRSPPDYDRRREDGPIERPKLQLQPRSKPKEDQSSTGNDK